MIQINKNLNLSESKVAIRQEKRLKKKIKQQHESRVLKIYKKEKKKTKIK